MESVNQSIQSTPLPEIPSNPQVPDKGSKALTVAVVVLAVIFLGVAGYAGYLYWGSQLYSSPKQQSAKQVIITPPIVSPTISATPTPANETEREIDGVMVESSTDSSELQSVSTDAKGL